MEQVDDILRLFIKSANKFEHRLGKIRDEEEDFPLVQVYSDDD